MAKLYFYYSAMNAGKSTMLLQSSHNYRERGIDTLLFTPQVDDRYEIGKITTRIGLQKDALPITDDTDFFDEVSRSCEKTPRLGCVLVDEAQFLTKIQVKQLGQVADRLKIPVLAYGIRSDYKGEPFPGSMYLLVWADELVEIKTICHCGRKASMNMRIDEAGNAIRTGNQVYIGGNESYVSTCRKHFWLGESAHRSNREPLTESRDTVR
jgi:thymidine kinase